MKENDLLLFFTVTAIALADILADNEINEFSYIKKLMGKSISFLVLNRKLELYLHKKNAREQLFTSIS